MSVNPRPRALIVSSDGAPGGAVISVMAALDAVGADLRAIDVGRVGARTASTFDKVVKAVVSDFAERRLKREWELYPPDVALGFDPASVEALVSASASALRGAPVLAVVLDASSAQRWTDVGADRYLAMDGATAAQLGLAGIPDDKVVVVGPALPANFAAAGRESREAHRKDFSLGGRIVLVFVEGLGSDLASQLAFQLSMVNEAKAPATYLFAAGADKAAATALRNQVPNLDMAAKLFGDTEDAPKLWRCADVLVAEPSCEMIGRAVAFNLRLVALPGGDAEGALALEKRGQAKIASSLSTVSNALESVWSLKAPAGRSRDGAGNIADIAWTLGSNCAGFLAEKSQAKDSEVSYGVRSAAAYADAAAAMNRKAGDLEDLSGGAKAPAPPDVDVDRLRALLSQKRARLKRVLAESTEEANVWDGKAKSARDRGDASIAEQSRRKADLERSRMHKALADLAALENESADLDRAEESMKKHRQRKAKASAAKEQRNTSSARSSSSVDDMLRDLKSNAGTQNTSRSTSQNRQREKKSLDDELEALKRRAQKGKV